MRGPVTRGVVLALVGALAAVLPRPDAAADPPPAGDAAPPTETPTSGEAAAPVAPTTGTLALTVEPAGAEILVDGAVVGAAPLAAEAPLEPGSHHIEIRSAGHVTWTRDVEVAAGQRVDIAVSLLVAAPRTPPPQPVEVTPPPPPPAAHTATPLGRGPVFWSGVAATGTLLAVGIITGSVALSQQSEYEQAGTSLARRRDLYDSMNGLATATDVLLDSAFVIGVATAVLFACLGPERPRRTTHGPLEWIGAHCF